jgi:hypothetical protein
MKSPQEVLESFLREKAEIFADADKRLAPLHAKYFGQPLLPNASDFLLRDTAQAVFEDVAVSEGLAKITTLERIKTHDLRMRYHLAKSGATWKIVRIDRECFYCQRTGKRSGAQCSVCGGEGWFDPRRNNG